MTRETKIGLLVGLAFIIVIGILLSDHINTSTEPPPAAMTRTFEGSQASLGSPDSRNQGTMTLVAPAPVIPQNAVPTQREPVDTSNPGSAVITISPGGDPVAAQMPVRPTPAQNTHQVDVLPPVKPAVAAANPDNTIPADPLQQLTQQNPDELVGPGTAPVGVHPNPAPLQNGSNALPASTHQIKAEEGDTVTRLAAKYLGGNTKANREAIIKANPSMTPDGHLVITGRTYVIPAASGAAVAVVPTPVPQTPGPHSAPAPASPAGTIFYTVKDNDSLWKIASEQLGSGSRWTEVRDLNADVLKGTANVRANMRLKLPPKTVATAN